MKLIFAILLLGITLFPTVTFATSTSWDYTANILQPLKSMWNKEVKVPWITATSTTQTSTLPKLTSTTICLTGDSCISVWPLSGGSPATTTIRGMFSNSVTGLSYSAVSGETSLVATHFLPTTTRASNWDQAFQWGNHASQGYITDGNTNWDNSYGFLTTADISVNNWQMNDGLNGIRPTTSVGIVISASSSFNGSLNVSSSSYNYIDSLFRVSTSSNTEGLLFSIKATSSQLTHTSSLLGFEQDTTVRISLGGPDKYLGMNGSLDQVTVHGRMRNDNWYSVDCPLPAGAVAITSDTAAATGGLLGGCNGFDFYEDTAATLTGFSGDGFAYGQLGNAAPTDGAGVFVKSLTAGWIKFATSTPSIEVTARIGAISGVGTASTTSFYFGFSNVAVAGTQYDIEPTAGCYFTASSTIPNWLAVCRTSATAFTKVDTLIASTSFANGAGNWKVFRVDADANQARFWIKNGSSTLMNVANIRTNVPTTTAMNAGIHFGRTNGVYPIQYDFYGLNFQWRRFNPNK